MMQAMTIETRWAPAGRRPAQCPCFPFGAKGASTGEGIRQRLPFRCNKTKTSRAAGRRSPWSPRRCHHQCFWQPKTIFGQDNLYYMFPFKMANCWRPSRSLFGERPRASINRASLHKGRVTPRRRKREGQTDIERSGRTLAERERRMNSP